VALLVASSAVFIYARQRGREDDASELAEARKKDLDDLAPGAAAGEGGSVGKHRLAFLGGPGRPPHAGVVRQEREPVRRLDVQRLRPRAGTGPDGHAEGLGGGGDGGGAAQLLVLLAAPLYLSVEERGGNAGEGLGWCLARYRGLEGVAWRSTAAGVVAGLALTSERGPRIGEAVGRDARAVLREGRREEGKISSDFRLPRGEAFSSSAPPPSATSTARGML
jgi:hypothetical protein